MIENFSPNNQEPPITLPEDATYDDLNQAHTEGSDRLGRTEDELHSSNQAKIDIARSYKNEFVNAKTIDDFRSLRSRLNPTNVGEKSEFDERIGISETDKAAQERKGEFGMRIDRALDQLYVNLREADLPKAEVILRKAKRIVRNLFKEGRLSTEAADNSLELVEAILQNIWQQSIKEYANEINALATRPLTAIEKYDIGIPASDSQEEIDNAEKSSLIQIRYVEMASLVRNLNQALVKKYISREQYDQVMKETTTVRIEIDEAYWAKKYELAMIQITTSESMSTIQKALGEMQNAVEWDHLDPEEYGRMQALAQERIATIKAEALSKFEQKIASEQTIEGILLLMDSSLEDQRAMGFRTSELNLIAEMSTERGNQIWREKLPQILDQLRQIDTVNSKELKLDILYAKLKWGLFMPEDVLKQIKSEIEIVRTKMYQQRYAAELQRLKSGTPFYVDDAEALARHRLNAGLWTLEQATQYAKVANDIIESQKATDDALALLESL